MFKKGDRVKILNLKHQRKGRVIEMFKHGKNDFFRVLYQNRNGDTFITTVMSKDLEVVKNGKLL